MRKHKFIYHAYIYGNMATIVPWKRLAENKIEHECDICRSTTLLTRPLISLPLPSINEVYSNFIEMPWKCILKKMSRQCKWSHSRSLPGFFFFFIDKMRRKIFHKLVHIEYATFVFSIDILRVFHIWMMNAWKYYCAFFFSH